MVNMTHRPNIHMRLRTLKLRLTHDMIPLFTLFLLVGSGDRDRTDDLPIMSRML